MTRRLLPILAVATLIALLAWLTAPEPNAERDDCIREAEEQHDLSPLQREAYDAAMRACYEPKEIAK